MVEEMSLLIPIMRRKRKGASGQPCMMPLPILNKVDVDPLIQIVKLTDCTLEKIQFIVDSSNLIYSRINRRKV